MSDFRDDLNNIFRAEQALILYKNEKVDYNYYPRHEYLLQMHRIMDGKIAEGTPITRQALVGLAAMVTPQIKDEAVFLSPEVLFFSAMNDLLVWWSPGGVRNLFFLKDTGIRSGKAAVPPTLFAVKGKDLHVWALK